VSGPRAESGELERLHPADVAYILEALPLEERQVVWDLVKAEREGEILLELSEAVRESLIATMDSKELVAAAETLEADQIADLAADLPEDVVQDVIRALPQEERALLRAALSYDEGTVGALMDFDQVTVREDVTLEAATRYLRALDELPAHTDQLFVVDRAGKLRGTLPLARLIVTDLARQRDRAAMHLLRLIRTVAIDVGPTQVGQQLDPHRVIGLVQCNGFEQQRNRRLS